ncbi:MAG: FKBP-type peptidyl-prolyl cis-trans isomerase [Bacteroidales bacterium]|jgi:FKBP-type peptidyl-prolyl cis-trans isomerase|nr:FKBP-type peptidyl-prolyl cis-trans isomerase [Bacteroidales bacterium]
MKKILTIALTLLITTTLISQNTMNYEQKISYILGYNIGNDINQMPFNFDVNTMIQGMKIAFDDQPSQFSDQDMQQTMQEWQMGMQFGQQNANAEFEQKVSYILGYNIGQNVSNEPFDFDYNAMLQGLRIAFDDNQNIEFTDEEMQEMLQEWQMNMQAEHQKRAASDIEKNKAAGRAFLEQNKQNKSVHVTPSGLQYRVVTMGTGPKPTSASDRVRVHYEGTLLDGTIFDSSYQRGEDITFALNQVIAGWTEGVQLMPVGSKFIFYIPSDLAYGDRAMGPQLPAGSTLIFTVELFGINE